MDGARGKNILDINACKSGELRQRPEGIQAKRAAPMATAATIETVVASPVTLATASFKISLTLSAPVEVASLMFWPAAEAASLTESVKSGFFASASPSSCGVNWGFGVLSEMMQQYQ
jgi:hypothetical protein